MFWLEQKNASSENVENQFVNCGKEENKMDILRQLMKETKLVPPVLVFVQTKDRAIALFKEMSIEYGGTLKFDMLHSERTQGAREKIIKQFRSGEIWILIATDLIGRGMDFKGIKTVVNFDLPESPAGFVHRVGRTGRAGDKGKSYTLWTESELSLVKDIMDVVMAGGGKVNAWMKGIQGLSDKKRKELEMNGGPKRLPLAAFVKQERIEKIKRHHKIQREKKRRKVDNGSGWTVVAANQS
eukprot:TRINITY_DN2881_c0_g2_i1.p2 TRINITY_DN2881_c0_g2~~TRINITY_DN2881_c0_g2_i1.p2  ORF type:complete len:241 (-),score=56.86 TRINITY_DN2881_c0_g2_i1:32-754(-)